MEIRMIKRGRMGAADVIWDGSALFFSDDEETLPSQAERKARAEQATAITAGTMRKGCSRGEFMGAAPA
jgi:hypothetical protein